MTDRPHWRRSYDTVERMLAPHAESLVRSREFTQLAALAFNVRRAVDNGVNGIAARVWHLVNLPAGTDVRRLRQQLGVLDREVRRLSLQLEQARSGVNSDD